MSPQFKTILEALHKKFGENLDTCLSEYISLLEEVEIKIRGTYELGQIIHQDSNISDTQREITNIFPEIFTDLTVACYLGCCAIDNTPKILLRRALELGIAVIYLWDLPYKFWSWKNIDDIGNDLNFKEMLDYINNAGYITYINKENTTAETELVNKTPINKIYRELSNVIHGKTDHFESRNPDRFTYNKEDLYTVLNFTLKIENILLAAWKKRFTNHFSKMEENLIAITKYNYEY